MSVAAPSDWRLRLEDRICHLETPFDEALVAAVRAIPGRLWDRTGGRWSVWLTPDRAWSLLRLVEHFPQLAENPEPVAGLRREAGLRSADRFDLELIMPRREGPQCVSLCDDWSDPELDRLAAGGDVIRHPASGRISVVLGHAAAAKVGQLARRDDMRLSRRLAEQVEILTGSEAESIAGDRRDDGRTQIRFGTRRHEVLITSAQADAFAETLPGSTRTGRYRVIAPAEPRVAVALAGLLAGDREALVAPAVNDWLKLATRWTGRVGATQREGTPVWMVHGNGAPPPKALEHPSVKKLTAADTWLIPIDPAGREALGELLREEPLTRVDQRALRAVDWVDRHPNEPPPPAVVTVSDDPESGERELVLEELWGIGLAGGFSTLPGARDGRPAVVADAWAPDSVHAWVLEHGVAMDSGARELLDRLLEEHEQADELVELSRATEAEIDIRGLGGQLMPFQEAGVVYALRRRRAFIADEQGLGKTVQALAAIEHDQAFPAIVVCPASLKLNWEREAHKWLPHRKTTLVSGRKPVDVSDAEIIVVNYDVVGSHGPRLAGLKPRALVLDESHYCKNPVAQRTKAVLELTTALPTDALLLALTGTPLVNRPKELVPQLRILGRLHEFGSGAELERRFGQNAERERLHWHLRRSCYVRRLKKDVLPQLPAKRRAVVPFDLDNEREYRHAERDLIAWVQERYSSSDDLNTRVGSALRAEALVKVNALRQLVGRGKLHAAHAWIHDFLASGEKLVVFAAHRAVQRDLLERFPGAAHILGDDTPAERDAQVQVFQNDPSVQLCICSLKVASHGFTLTAASDVAFLELGWTPAEHDQAEDRAHRIGQSDSVTAWYLLAADTIDERMAALIDAKREVVGAVTDGTVSKDVSMIDALMESYSGRGS
jgi:SWI/SNF-related matrix-associated actin-dependent regulator 1 of chromatin subfamily A